MSLTSRDRLLTTMRREVPDRIPYTYDATSECSENLRAYLGLQSIGEIRDYFGCDKIGNIGSLIGKDYIHWNQPFQAADGTPVTLWGTPLKRVEYSGGSYMEYAKPPLSDMETTAEIEAYPWPDPDKVTFEPLPAQSEWKVDINDYIIGDMSFIGPYGIAWQIRGMEGLMMDMIADPEIVEAIVARIEAFTLPVLERFLQAYAGHVDYVGCGDDFGTQLGLLMSREHFQQFFAPSLKRHFEMARSYGVMAYQHCCGAIFEIIPDLIDCGVQVLNPIQTSANGMDPTRLKQEFGNQLAFHGAMDIQQTLPNGTADDVRREVLERVQQMGPNGFILSPSHSMQTDIPLENIVAMYDEIRQLKLS